MRTLILTNNNYVSGNTFTYTFRNQLKAPEDIDAIALSSGARLIKLLSNQEKEILNQFVKITNIPVDVEDEDLKQWRKNYDILTGELESGNDNEDLKKKLKEYVHTGLKLGRIKKTEAFDILRQL